MDKNNLRLLWAVRGPIIVPRKTGCDPPELLRELVPRSRMEETIRTGEEMASDVEALIYVSCASLEVPLDSDWIEIMAYLLTGVMKKYSNIDVPEDLQRNKLSDYQRRLLNDLKQWLYKKGMEYTRKLMRDLAKEGKHTSTEIIDSDIPEIFSKSK